MKLDRAGSDLILAAVRLRLPEGVTVRRRASGNLIIKHKSARFEWHAASSPAFRHVSRRSGRAGALAIGYRQTLRAVTDHLRRSDLSWPEAAWGPIQVDVHFAGSVIEAILIDVEGQVIASPSIEVDR